MILQNEIANIKDFSFFNRVMFLFENNIDVNSLFINEIKDREYSDFSNCINIKFDKVNACISLNDIYSNGTYISSTIKTYVDEDSYVNNFFLVVDETKPVGTDILYYILTDENDKVSILPNSHYPLKIDSSNIPKSFKLIAELKNNGNSSPTINSFSIMYYDDLTDSKLGLIQPNIENEYIFNTYSDNYNK